jgi:lysine/ornithine N-monooxygenase
MEKMNIKELIDLLGSFTRLIDELERSAEFIHKDEIQQYLRWTAKNIAKTIWEMELAGL